MKKWPTEGEKIFMNYMSDRGLVIIIDEELKRLTINRQITQF